MRTPSFRRLLTKKGSSLYVCFLKPTVVDREEKGSLQYPPRSGHYELSHGDTVSAFCLGWFLCHPNAASLHFLVMCFSSHFSERLGSGPTKNDVLGLSPPCRTSCRTSMRDSHSTYQSRFVKSLWNEGQSWGLSLCWLIRRSAVAMWV